MTDNGLGDLHEALPSTPDGQVVAALAEAAAWVGRGGVEAVGLGEQDGSPCVVVHVRGEAAALPAAVGGLPVRVERTGPIQALDDTASSAQPGPPTPGTTAS